jgi:hypothetical protein
MEPSSATDLGLEFLFLFPIAAFYIYIMLICKSEASHLALLYPSMELHPEMKPGEELTVNRDAVWIVIAPASMATIALEKAAAFRPVQMTSPAEQEVPSQTIVPAL